MMGASSYALRIPGTTDEYVVHRQVEEDYVFLFDVEAEAAAFAEATRPAYGFLPEVVFVGVSTLRYRMARFKPEHGDQVDVRLGSTGNG